MRKIILFILSVAFFVQSQGQYTKLILTLPDGTKMSCGYRIPTPPPNGSKPQVCFYEHGIDHIGPPGDTITANGISKVTGKGYPSLILSGDLPTYTIPGGVTPKDDRGTALFFMQCPNTYSTWPVSALRTAILWVKATLSASVDTSNFFGVGYSYGGGGMSGAAGDSVCRVNLKVVYIIGMGYTGASNYAEIANSNLKIKIFACKNDLKASVTISDNWVRNINSYNPLSPVEFYRFENLPDTATYTLQHDIEWKRTMALTKGAHYTLTNTDVWVQFIILEDALKYKKQRYHR